MHSGKRITLGPFATAEQAAQAQREYLASHPKGKPGRKPGSAKSGPKPKTKGEPIPTVAKPAGRSTMGVTPTDTPAPSNDPIATAKAVLALAEILGPLDATARKSALKMVAELCGVGV